jgi:hypothetical protein
MSRDPELNDRPYVVPVGIADEENDIYVFSTTGQKIKWMRSNPQVCVQVDEIRSSVRLVQCHLRRIPGLPEPQFEPERAHARRLREKTPSLVAEPNGRAPH